MGSLFKCDDINLFLMILPSMSFHSKLVPAHYREHKYVVLKSVLLLVIMLLLLNLLSSFHIFSRQSLKACVVLFPLFGVTWIFGVLTVTDAGLIFQYLFTILNSLQVKRKVK